MTDSTSIAQQTNIFFKLKFALNFAIKLQQMLPTILMCTQDPMVLEGFGNVPYTREAFKRVSLEIILKKKTVKSINSEDINSIALSFRLPMKDFHTLWFYANLVDRQ